MRLLNRAVGWMAVVVGLVLVGWAPPILALLSGHALPAPVASDPAAMVVWSGVAFARVCGAVVAGMGAVLFASSAVVFRPSLVAAALLASSVLATAVVASQQVAIWTNALGWGLVFLFACFAAAAGLQLARSSRNRERTA